MRSSVRRMALLAAGTATVLTAGLLTAVSAQAAAGCRVSYRVTNQWQGGFGADLTVTNLGDAINGWTLTWSFPAGQTVTQLWNGTHTQSGAQVRVTNVGYNGSIATNASVGLGFNGSWNNSSNPAPASFALNGTTCTGATTPTSPTPRPTPTPTPPGGSCTAQPVDPQATAQARRLLCYLYSQYGNHILSGQQESTWVDGPDYEMNYIYSRTGKYPAIRGLDMGDSPTFGSRAVSWWNAGGIPMVGYHMGSPAQGQDGYAGSQMNANINAALTPGTADHTRFLQRLDAAAAQLAQAQAAGAAVIWRPFHEAGGTWFWWSKEGGSQYVRLWRFVFDYYTKTKGLHNLVWLHPFNGSPTSSFYPGKAYVDVGGADTYAGDHGPLTSLFNSTRSIVGGTVPIALHENGRIPDPGQLQSSATRWVLFNTWHSTFVSDTSVNPVSTFQQVYGSSYVVTRDEVPNLR
ncbi:glycosyl hydrolase [Micromonospora sp. 067-2]|uniref:glycosyl hydrolase n=1 Tax=Micromonospora sp. 067-2 TaxID=2789270 RepID=UPI00397C5611